MKQYSQRVIKVLASFVTIVMILICTVAMPVFAALPYYTLPDLLASRTVDGDDVILRFSASKVGVSPYIEYYVDDVLTSWTSSPNFVFNFDELAAKQAHGFTVYPFGANFTTKPRYGLIKVSDLKRYETISVKVQIGVQSNTDPVAGNWRIAAYTFCNYYDASYNGLGSVRSEVTNDSWASSGVNYYYRYDGNLDIEIPDDCAFIGIGVRYTVHAGFEQGDTLQFNYNYADLHASYNSIIEDSVTLKNIDDQLADLNDKMDTVIQGDPGWSDQAQDDFVTQESIDTEIDSAIDDLDDKTNLDNVLPDGAKQPEDLENYVNNWIGTAGWTQVLTVFKPILQNGNFTAILFMIVAFINISVLLLGR